MCSGASVPTSDMDHATRGVGSHVFEEPRSPLTASASSLGEDSSDDSCTEPQELLHAAPILSVARMARDEPPIASSSSSSSHESSRAPAAADTTQPQASSSTARGLVRQLTSSASQDRLLALSPHLSRDLQRPNWALKDFKIVKNLGSGKSSKVYQVREERGGRDWEEVAWTWKFRAVVVPPPPSISLSHTGGMPSERADGGPQAV
jgi:hypothetical protein